MIVPEIMRVGFKYIAETNSGYTAIRILSLIPSPLVIRQGGNCGTSTKIGFPVAFTKFCGAVTLGQIYGGSRSDHYGNLGKITATGFTKDSWNSMYIAIGI